MVALPDPVMEAIGTARSEGRTILSEPDALGIAVALGIGIPATQIVTGPDEVDLEAMPGERVVVKALAPGLIHKTETGAVAVVGKTEVAATMAEMGARIPAAQSFLVAEYVDHDPGLWGEILLGMRWTDEFGPVVTFGLGGTAAEFLTGLAGDRANAVFSPALRDGVAGALDGLAVTAPLTGGFRGGEPSVDRPGLEALIGRMLDLAARTMPADISEFEINPLTFTDRGPVALDAMCRIGPAPVAEARPDLRPGAVDGILRPSSIAIVGVSERVNLGRVILRNVLDAGFPPDAVTVIKPGIDEIDGVRCVPDLESMGFVDLLVVAIGAEQVPGLVEEVTSGGMAGAVVLIPGGLGELKGSEAQAERIADALRTAPQPRPVVNGGNCMGIRSVPGRYDTTFIPGYKLAPAGRTGRHPVAVISQSGAFLISRLDRLAWLDPAYLITVGNQIDLTVGDYLDHVADDPEVAVAACYVEGFRPGDGLRWAGAAARMRARGGMVILYRGGRTKEGARSAASHTAAVAGDVRVATGLAEAAGVLMAGTLSEFEDLVRLAVLWRERPVTGMGLGAVSNAGFEAVAIADNLGGLLLAGLSDATLSRITELLEGEGLGGVVAAVNPLDLTPNCTAAAYTDAVEAMLGDPAVDVGLVGCVPLTPALHTLPPGRGHDEDVTSRDSLASRLVALWGTTTKPWAAVVDAGASYDPMVQMLEEAGIPTFRSADRALQMLGRYCREGVRRL